MTVVRSTRFGAVGVIAVLVMLWPLGSVLPVGPRGVQAAPGGAGSAPVGSTSYPVPADAVFVAALDGTGGLGTEASPYQSVATAVSRAVTGSTLVLRGGTYRESVRIPFGKALTIQSYPGEAVWFDGAAPVTGWTQSGSTWVRSGWTYLFDHRVSFGVGMDESSRYVDPARPMAGHADAVWVDGKELTQVASEAEVGAGEFYVDETGQRLVIGTDPTGRTVEASELAQAIQVHGAGSTFRGFGVKRYAAHLALYGAVSNEVDDVTFENLVIADNATLGIGGWGDRATYRNLTVTGNGLLGLAADKAPGLVVTRSVFTGNNDQGFKQEPVSGGIKTSNTDGAEFSDNLIDSNRTTGLWLDVSMRNFRIVRNKITGNGEGLEVELSGHGTIADNYIARNREAGLFLFDTNDLTIRDNTLEANSRSVQILQDERRNEDAATKDDVPWVTSGLRFRGNTVIHGGGCPLLVQDLTGRWSADDFGIDAQGTRYFRTPGFASPGVACALRGESARLE
jgi:parallel beta-helix repeat protein